MKPIKFDFVAGPLTIQWIPSDVRVAKIRCHVDPKVMPGPTRYTALIEFYPEKKLFELTTLAKSGDAMKGPYRCEHRSVEDYMFECFSAIGLWRRAKRGAVKVVAANVGGNSAQISKKESSKMGTKRFEVVARVVDEETGKVDSTATVGQEQQTSLGVCDLQDLLADTYVAALRVKGREFAQAKADAEAKAAQAAA